MTTAGEIGMATAASHADPHDIAKARMAAGMLAAGGDTFTVEDVTAALTPVARERLEAFPNALGGLFYHLHRSGLLEDCGYTRAKRPAARGRPIHVWRGTGKCFT